MRDQCPRPLIPTLQFLIQLLIQLPIQLLIQFLLDPLWDHARRSAFINTPVFLGCDDIAVTRICPQTSSCQNTHRSLSGSSCCSRCLQDHSVARSHADTHRLTRTHTRWKHNPPVLLVNIQWLCVLCFVFHLETVSCCRHTRSICQGRFPETHKRP